MTRPVSKDFIAAMEEKLEHGRKMGKVGWDSHWKDPNLKANFTVHTLRNILEEEFWELEDLVFVYLDYADSGTTADLAEIRHEAADVANVAMMIADMVGALKEEKDA